MASWAINEGFDAKHHVVREICYAIARGIISTGYVMPSPHSFSQQNLTNPRIVEMTYAKLAEAGVLDIQASGDFLITADSASRAREYLKHWAKKELKRLVDTLKCAGLATEEIQAVFQEASDA